MSCNLYFLRNLFNIYIWDRIHGDRINWDQIYRDRIYLSPYKVTKELVSTKTKVRCDSTFFYFKQKEVESRINIRFHVKK